MRIYLDHAATTPVDDIVLKSMQPYFADKFGNPSSIYTLGREAKDALCESRHAIAEMIGADKPGEIIFTSGATESNNLAIKGVAFYASQIFKVKPHIMVSSIEHHCVLDSVKYLEKYFDFEVSYIPVDHEGVVDLKYIENNIKENTVLVSVMYGNNETGTIEPISKIGDIVKAKRAKRKDGGDDLPLYFHTDAVQAFQFLGLDVNALGVDLLSLTGHKFYGPKGVGILYARRGVKFLAQQQGGAQERNQRAGTENVPYIVGMTTAMKNAEAKRGEYNKNITEMRDYLIKEVAEKIDDVELIGPKDVDKRLPHIASFLIRRIEGESILINLDLIGIAASSGSACTSGSLEPSHVTKAMGYGDMEAHGATRFSFGKLNKKEDVDELMSNLPSIVEKLRAMSPIK